MSYKETILSFITDINDLKGCSENIKSSVQCTYNECLQILLHNLNSKNLDLEYFKINTVLDYLHEDLNTGHWSEVSVNIRQTFTACSFIKAYIIIAKNKEISVNTLREALKCIDLGLLLGAPLIENAELLLKTASYLTKQINALSEISVNCDLEKKRKHSDFKFLENSIRVCCEKCPSIEAFDKTYFRLHTPVKLQDCMGHWPAMKKWEDVNYLLSVAGERTVPIEIGSHYADDDWGQKLMTVRTFIENYFLKTAKDTGYLAQHNLFDQICELREDIHIPEYCCLSENYEESCDPDINAWLGPANTVSPLHYDPKDNILAQVFGTKHIVLFSPEDSDYLYPHQDLMLTNTAQVNPLDPDLSTYPEFTKAKIYECYLEPGEMLFIPKKWWHHVTSLEKSFSVSFWWK